MKIIYPSNTYILSNPEDYNFFSALLEEKIEEVELTLFEDVAKVIISKNPQEYYDELYLQRSISKIKELLQASDYFAYKGKINTYKIYNTQTQKKTQKLIEENIDKVNWPTICVNLNLSTEFWEKYLDKIDWYYLSYNKYIPVEFLEEHLDRVNWYWLSINSNFPTEFWEKYLDPSSGGYTDIEYRRMDGLKWGNLCQNTNLPVEFWEKHLDKVDWLYLSHCANLPTWFWEKHLDKIDWWYLSYNSNLEKDFIEKYLDKLHWKNLIKEKNHKSRLEISVENCEKYINKIDWREFPYDLYSQEERDFYSKVEILKR